MLKLYKSGLIPETLVKGFEKYTKKNPVWLGRMLMLSFPAFVIGSLIGMSLIAWAIFSLSLHSKPQVFLTIFVIGSLMVLGSGAFCSIVLFKDRGDCYYFSKLIEDVSKELGIPFDLFLQRDLHALADRRLFKQATIVTGLQSNPETATSPKTKEMRDEFTRIHHMFMVLGLVEEDWSRFFKASKM